MSFPHDSEVVLQSLIVAFPGHTCLHFGTSVRHKKTMCYVYDLDPYVKVKFTGQDHTCNWNITYTSSF